MNFSSINGVVICGLNLFPAEIQCALSKRMPYLRIIGIPSSAAQDMKDRVMAALDSNGIRLPPRRITLEIRPEMHASGLEFLDLPVALAILAAAGMIPAQKLDAVLVVGGLGLDGKIKKMAQTNLLGRFWELGPYKGAIFPWENSSILPDTSLKFGGGFKNLAELIDFFRCAGALGSKHCESPILNVSPMDQPSHGLTGIDPLTRRFLEISAIGGHSALIFTPTGSDNQNIGLQLASLMPDLCDAQKEILNLRYLSRGLEMDARIPIRSVGPGTTKKTFLGDKKKLGDLFLTHGGVLSISNFFTLHKGCIESLNPIFRSGGATLELDGRSQWIVCDFILMAMSKPCWCGNSIKGAENCSCTFKEKKRFNAALSQYSRELFDLVLNCSSQMDIGTPKGSAWIHQYHHRRASKGIVLNAKLREGIFERKVWTNRALKVLKSTDMSTFAQEKIAKVALSISDLNEESSVSEEAVLEARFFSYDYRR